MALKKGVGGKFSDEQMEQSGFHKAIMAQLAVVMKGNARQEVAAPPELSDDQKDYSAAIIALMQKHVPTFGQKKEGKSLMSVKQHAIAMQKLTTALDPSKAPTENNAAAQFRAMMKGVHELHEAGREELDKLKSQTDLSPAERDEKIFRVRAAMAQFAQHITSTGELPDDMRPGGLDKYGLDYDSLSKLNPRLVYGSGTGYGLAHCRRMGIDAAALDAGPDESLAVLSQAEDRGGSEAADHVVAAFGSLLGT